MNSFQRLLQSLAKNKDLVANVGAGSAMTAGFGTLAGGPVQGLAYGLGDLSVALPLTALARKVRPPKASATRFAKDAAGNLVPEMDYSRLETVANIGGSIVSPILTEAVAGPLFAPQVEPTAVSQEQQIMQQMMQRQAINQLEEPQAVAPGTQYQAVGIEQTFLDDYRSRLQRQLAAYNPQYAAALQEIGAYS
jgi:hypothetical protein